MSAGEDWRDATEWGASYQQQVNRSGQMRHRKWRFVGEAVKAAHPDDGAPWLDGPAPREPGPDATRDMMSVFLKGDV